MFKNELKLSKLIDHSLLSANVTSVEIDELCQQALKYNFKMVAINQVWTQHCSKKLADSDIHIGAAIAFPLGQTTIKSKVNETKDAIENGADEIDYVLNIGKLLEKDYKYIEKEMKQISDVCKKNNVISKVIIETGYLKEVDIIAVCEIAKAVKPTYIKTSTGFGLRGASLSDIKLISKYIGDEVLIKAAGGIKDLKTVKELVKHGASRIGTSSGINIIEQYRQSK